MNEYVYKSILEYEQYILIYKLSYIHFISSIYAFIYQPYTFGLLNFLSVISSINYWKYPLYNWKRTMDIITVNSTMLYYLYKAFYSNYGLYYYLVAISSIISFIVSHYYYNIKDMWKSTGFHILVHIYGFIGNMILFSGNIL